MASREASSTTPKTTSISDRSSPAPTAVEPVSAPPVTRGSLLASSRTRSRTWSRCSVVNMHTSRLAPGCLPTGFLFLLRLPFVHHQHVQHLRSLHANSQHPL